MYACKNSHCWQRGIVVAFTKHLQHTTSVESGNSGSVANKPSNAEKAGVLLQDHGCIASVQQPLHNCGCSLPNNSDSAEWRGREYSPLVEGHLVIAVLKFKPRPPAWPGQELLVLKPEDIHVSNLMPNKAQMNQAEHDLGFCE